MSKSSLSGRWNCRSISKAPTYDDDLRRTTKETALVYALSASSLALQIANGCMAGKVSECSCRWFKHPPINATLNSLSEGNLYQANMFPTSKIKESNINDLVPCKGILKEAVKFARTFTRLGFPLRWRSDRHRMDTAIRKHNMDVGFKELSNQESVVCKCTGFTGGCTYKFCHRRVIQFKTVASRLLQKYNNGVKIDYNTITAKGNGSQKLLTGNKNHQGKLLYLIRLPNQCRGWQGSNSVSGRQCVLHKTKVDSCRKLCCQRGYRKKRIEVHSECRCKFVYCCEIKCDTCVTYKNIYQCL